MGQPILVLSALHLLVIVVLRESRRNYCSTELDAVESAIWRNLEVKRINNLTICRLE
jgi:hypothetical protein